ncbi:Uncharacterized protein Fot_37815 [Forsythia ovata]|uniref:Uncharacterized protein n=1 Tax=Forsythia ovata TaxID=205694 RepID=A0ABD1S015_9LAMI
MIKRTGKANMVPKNQKGKQKSGGSQNPKGIIQNHLRKCSKVNASIAKNLVTPLKNANNRINDDKAKRDQALQFPPTKRRTTEFQQNYEYTQNFYSSNTFTPKSLETKPGTDTLGSLLLELTLGDLHNLKEHQGDKQYTFLARRLWIWVHGVKVQSFLVAHATSGGSACLSTVKRVGSL